MLSPAKYSKKLSDLSGSAIENLLTLCYLAGQPPGPFEANSRVQGRSGIVYTTYFVLPPLERGEGGGAEPRGRGRVVLPVLQDDHVSATVSQASTSALTMSRYPPLIWRISPTLAQRRPHWLDSSWLVSFMRSLV